MSPHTYDIHIHKEQLSRHTGTGWSGGGGGSGTRGRTDSDGAEQRPPGRPLLCLPERAVCAAPSGAQGSVAARGRAAAVASRRAARARRGGQVIGRRVMGRRVTAPSDRSEPIVARPQLTSKACGARLSVSGGGRHVARREDDKCASYGSLFIGQSSGTQVETEHGRRKAGGAGAGGR